MKRFFVVIAVLTVVLSSLLAWRMQRQARELDRLPGSSGVVEGTRVAVSPRVAGRILKVPAREGDVVKAGDVLVELDCTETDALLRETTARVEAARLQVELARTQAEAAALQAKAAKRQAAGTRAQIGSLEVQGENARRQSDRAVKLKDEEVLAAATWESADAMSRDLERRVAAAGIAAQAASLQAKVVDRQARGAGDGVKAAEAGLAAAQAGLERVKVLQDECTIEAPRSGVVTLRAKEPGEVVLPGAIVLEITDLSEARVTFYVANADLGRVAVGGRVEARADAWPGEPFEGRVARVSAEAEFTPRNIQTREDRERLVYEVEARLDDPKGRLRAGMPVEVAVLPP